MTTGREREEKCGDVVIVVFAIIMYKATQHNNILLLHTVCEFSLHKDRSFAKLNNKWQQKDTSDIVEQNTQSNGYW